MANPPVRELILKGTDMGQNIITVITPIRPGYELALRRYLQNRIEPDYYEASKAVACKQDMPFDKLNNLHFASFVILGKDQDICPCLIFEATVDGDIGAFLEAFVAVAGAGLDGIYEHCVGYPETGHLLPHLVKRYLSDHDVGYNTFYSGHPGRTVAEILGENTLRSKILEFVKKHRDHPGALAPSLRGIQRQIQRHVVHQEPERTERLKSWIYGPPNKTEQPNMPELEWAEEAVAEPFAVKYGRILMICLGLMAVAIAAWILLMRSGVSTGGLICYIWYANSPTYNYTNAFDATSLSSLVGVIVTYPFHLFAWLPEIPAWAHGWISDTENRQIARCISILLVNWLIFRFLHLLFALWEHSGNAGITWVLWGAVRNAIAALQWLGLGILIGFAIIILPRLTAEVQVTVVGHGLVPALTLLFVSLAALGVVWLIIRYLKGWTQIADGHPHANIVWRGLRSFAIDVLQVLLLIPIWFSILIIVSWYSQLIVVIFLAAFGVGWLLLMAACAFLVLAALFLVALAWLISVFAREKLYDSSCFERAEVLTEDPVGSESFEREGHGINKVQNHLVSLSYIKPGRRLRLRVVLFMVNLQCRWWFNRGDLGGVGDIHFLRWIIIDKGRRLLFLDNYHGSWESYLSAFVDGPVVKGMNAIWSHTYVTSKKTGSKRVGFPLTACLFWKGARHERPFKEIVRTSQQKTLVWYSAYPSLSGTNIITNGAIRKGLFQNLDTAALDALAQRLR
jgi:hypothetical protein